MHIRIQRQTMVQRITVGTSTASSTSARFDDAAGGSIVVKGNTASATLTVWASQDDATFAPLAGADGAAATLTLPASDAAIDVPAAAFAARYVRLVSSTPLSAGTTVTVALKS